MFSRLHNSLSFKVTKLKAHAALNFSKKSDQKHQGHHLQMVKYLTEKTYNFHIIIIGIVEKAGKLMNIIVDILFE